MLTICENETFVDLKFKDVDEDRYLIGTYGTVIDKYKNKMVEPSLTKQGYLFTALYTKNGRIPVVGVHRLVATNYVKNDYPDIRTTVNHIDHDRTNNYYKNLEWLTLKENIRHANNFKEYKDERPEKVVYTDDQKHMVCKLLCEEKSIKVISSKTKVPENVIGFVKKRKIWKKISVHYNFDKPAKRDKFRRLYPLFDFYAERNTPWGYIKNKYNIHGERTKTLRALYRRRCKKLQRVQRLSK